jgi:hypothetical protein
MYPNKDAPYYRAGFTATVILLAASIVLYSTLPICLRFEAGRRKTKTGHALPLRSLEDSENSQVSAAALAGMHRLNQLESEGKGKLETFHEEDVGGSLPGAGVTGTTRNTREEV